MGDRGAAVRSMLGARSVAVVGASARPGSFGARLVAEISRSPSAPAITLVNPRYDRIGDLPSVPSLADIGDSVDLVLLGVPDSALEAQLSVAASRGDRSAVIYGSVVGPASDGSPLRDRVATIARDAGMAVCGGGCMGFVHVVNGLRAIGYIERDPLPAGPLALVTHSGSAFSALLRTRRRLGFSLAVSSGQELVTTTADYLEHALDLPETRVIGLLLETMREGPRLVAALHRAAAADVPVVLLSVGGSPMGQAMVAAHSGAVAGADAGWEALCDATGALRVRDLDELVNTLELLGTGRRAGANGPGSGSGSGIATVHDSGAERTLVADIAHDLQVPFAAISPDTTAALAARLDPGLEATNPLDVWGTGADTRSLFGDCLRTMLADPAVAVAALAVDLTEEYDGDTAYVDAMLDLCDETTKPLVVLGNLISSIDLDVAGRLRDRGVPVLEGTASGLAALGHLLALAERAERPALVPTPVDVGRQRRWLDRLAAGPLSAADGSALLDDYGIDVVASRQVGTRSEAVAAATELGYPVVLKTDMPEIAHKTEVGGVRLGLTDADAVASAYDDLAARLGPRVLVAQTAPPGVELSLGIVRDAQLGPLVVAAAGGILVELLADRSVALPPVDAAGARRMLDRLRVRPVLDGVRGAAAADLDAVCSAIVAVAQIAVELGEALDALDVNPVLAGPGRCVAVDVLVVSRSV
jgi:acyl-CoA synthetase (NDP forming)